MKLNVMLFSTLTLMIMLAPDPNREILSDPKISISTQQREAV